MSRDFRLEKSKDAACKNAFVLLGQHRPELAAAFFVLGNDTKLLPSVHHDVCVCVCTTHHVPSALMHIAI